MQHKARFVKMNGIGNQILVLDLQKKAQSLSQDFITNLNQEINFDQLMTILPATIPNADFKIEIFNQDGSKAGACGNGMRCVAEYLYQTQQCQNITFQTSSGLLSSTHLENGMVCVNMGQPKFAWDAIPLSHNINTKQPMPVQCGPLKNGYVVSMGNPHLVFWIDDWQQHLLLNACGPKLEHDPLFPERINISIAHILDKNHIRIKTWERGAGLTQACGSAACAVAILSHLYYQTQRQITLHLPGGDLQIHWLENNQINMTGPTEFEFFGFLSLENGNIQRDL